MNNISTRLLIFCIRLFSKLPFQTVQSIGSILGRLIIKHDKRTVVTMDLNLSFCLPEKTDKERLAIRNARLKHMGQTLFEMSHLWTKEPTQLLSHLYPKYDNTMFEEATKSDQGIIFLAPHIGNWEMINFYLSQFRTPTFMYRPQRSQLFDEFICESRSRIGANLAPASIKGVTQLMKVLKKGGLVGVLPDQVPKDSGGVYAPFYNQMAYTMTLAQKLALKTNAKVFIGAAYRVKGGYELLIEPISDDFYSEDSDISANSLNQSIESIVNRHPEQYQWEYKRFKKQLGEKNIY